MRTPTIAKLKQLGFTVEVREGCTTWLTHTKPFWHYNQNFHDPLTIFSEDVVTGAKYMENQTWSMGVAGVFDLDTNQFPLSILLDEQRLQLLGQWSSVRAAWDKVRVAERVHDSERQAYLKLFTELEKE